MISIVVCSVNPEKFNNYTNSVSSTIGVPFEIIRIDNRLNKYSICQAYNFGTKQSNFDIICFTHEDIIYQTKDWGKELIRLFNDESVGMAGVLGICYISLFPVMWSDTNECEGQVRVGALEGKPVSRYHRFNKSESETRVVALDGIFMAIRKSLFSNQIKFSEDIINGFHGYDLDISLQIFTKKYKILVTRNILFLHDSGGTFNEDYFDTMRKLYIKWEKHLPAYIDYYTANEIKALKLKSLEIYFQERKTIKERYSAFRYALHNGALYNLLKNHPFVFITGLINSTTKFSLNEMNPTLNYSKE